MPILKISRQHTFSQDQAQSMAQQWARDAERDFGMETVLDKTTERWNFKRSGVHGSLVTSAQSFELELHLGFLLGAFQDKIKQQIEKNLDQLLGPAKG
jgi:putative polyhydroxyalkanoate system protein